MSVQDLLVEGADLDDNKFEEIYEPLRSASDTDENVRISSIKLNVVRCLHTTSRDEDCRWSSVF